MRRLSRCVVAVRGIVTAPIVGSCEFINGLWAALRTHFR